MMLQNDAVLFPSNDKDSALLKVTSHLWCSRLQAESANTLTWILSDIQK